MADAQFLVAGVDIAIDRFEVAVFGWARGALRGQSTCIVLFDEIDSYLFAALAPPVTPAAAAARSDARLGRRAARRQRGSARAARRATATRP